MASSGAKEAARRDTLDELAEFRTQFYLQPGTLYLDGNSLGLLCRPAEASLLRVLTEWKTLGIKGWTDAQPPWFFLAEELGKQVAPLVGAAEEEVIITNSTTVNLHQLLVTLYKPVGTRRQVLIDALSFPSDRYAVESFLRRSGSDWIGNGHDHRSLLAVVGSSDGLTLDEDALIAAMTEEVQMAILPVVLYTSGQWLDVSRLTAAARERGVLLGLDCSHSIGAVPHALSDWGVDFAFWCSYKYLNAGPGATGGLYLNRRHFGQMPGLAGWFSSDKARQMDMAEHLDPAEGAGGLQIGTPNILSMAPLEGALQLLAEAGLERLRARSLRLTEYLMALVEAELSAYGFTIATPREAHRRGGHVALVHPEAVRICKALRAANVIPDYRPPNIVRLAPVALYTTFVDCYEAIQRLKRIMEARLWKALDRDRELVP